MAIFVPHILAHTKYYAGVGKFDNPGEEHGLRKYNIESALVIVHIAAALLHALRSLCILRWSNQVAAPEATPHRHVTMRYARPYRRTYLKHYLISNFEGALH